MTLDAIPIQDVSNPGSPRVLLFTDTLADVNGVARFIRDMGRCADHAGRSLTLVTSTRLPCPSDPWIVNLPPRLATSMPGYPTLDIVSPPWRRVRALLRRLRPHAVHISTPGPVGLAARWAAARVGIPMLGVHHTDFPSYVEHLFDDRALAWIAERGLRWFYRPFARVLTRSAQFTGRLADGGYPCARLKRLRPGTDIRAFSPGHADAGIWARLGLGRPGVAKVLYVGRVSVEKNLPFLAAIWPVIERQLAAIGLAADLVVIGDGPYRAALTARLRADSPSAYFAGARHGAELAALYASADLLVFPSATDTLGQVVLEAQASGLPVIVADAGGPKEIVRPGVTGLVLPAHDQAAWTRAVVELVADADRARAMGRAARAWAENHDIADSFAHFWAEHEAVHRASLARRGLIAETPAERDRRQRLNARACP